MPHFGRFDMGGMLSRSPTAVTPTASPYVFTAPSNGLVVISGGTVSVVQYGRGASVVALGLTSGVVPVSQGDTITVTWAVTAPTVTFIPS
jgi:hypothetical protein